MAPDPRLQVLTAGLAFANPIGLAAGYDKNGEAPEAILRLGFGFTDVGTVTPKPQAGNPKPRLFSLVEDAAVINRFGFNNDGHDAVLTRLGSVDPLAVVGLNIGANKDAVDRVADYVSGIHALYRVAHFFIVNISSPNTPGLRDSLKVLLDAVVAARNAEAQNAERQVPVFLKIAPDLTEEGLDEIATEMQSSGFDGLIVSNTTLSREGLIDRTQAKQEGGLSGKPLFDKSTAVLARMRKRLGKDFPIIGVGGVSSAETAAEKIRAGADLVQLYSAMGYEGPGLAAWIVSGLSTLCDRERLTSLRDIRDSRLDYWLDQNI